MAARLLLAVAGAFVAWGLWLGEVMWVKGWAGLAWLSGFNWAAVPICLVIAAVSSYVVAAEPPRRDRFAFIASAFLVMLLAFIMGRWAVFGPFAFYYDRSINWAALRDVLVVIAVGLGACAGIATAARLWLAPLHGATAALLAAGLLAVIPLSLLSIRVIPAFDGGADAIDAVKMGYPVFWTALLVPLALQSGHALRSRTPIG